MGLRCERFSLDTVASAAPGTVRRRDLLPGEIEGVRTELVSLKGPACVREPADPDACVVLIGLDGRATVAAGGATCDLPAESVARLPCGEGYEVRAAEGDEAHLLRVVKALDSADKAAVAARPECAKLDGRRFAECPTYSEGVKSARTVNRRILREGILPRFCLGSVETVGPDEVAAHEHPILEQLFLGLRGCRCTVFADGARAELTEHCLLHVPLGSTHRVAVAEGDRLYYLWFDFFLDLAGESWITRQHVPDDRDG